MNGSEDQRLKCVDCGEEFLFTVGEQEFYRQHGLAHAPIRCKRCREARKGRRTGGRAASDEGAGQRPREMFAAVCSECGAQTEVPFAPTSGRPIYCKDCFQSHRPRRGQRAAASPGAAPTPVATAAGSRPQGSIKWFNESRGFGFIQGDGGEEIFVHFSAIQSDGAKTLTQGDRVEFDVVSGSRGKQAANVVRIG